MKFAKEMKFFEGVPTEPISASELIMQEQEILAKNAENQRLRENTKKLEEQANEISERIQADNKLLTKVLAQLETARKSTAFCMMRVQLNLRLTLQILKKSIAK